jgi:hypothetical protein
MWAINNMFGIGTRGFVIITTIITVGTYAVVFWLLNSIAFRDGFGSLRENFWLKRDSKVDEKGAKVTRSPTTVSVKGKEKEGNIIADEELLNSQTLVDIPASKKSLLSRFRRGKAQAGDQEAGSS